MTTLWIIESTYLKPTDEIAQVTPAHREWLDQHYRSGVFLTSGRKVDNTGGVIVAQADTLQELVDLFDHDPSSPAAAPLQIHRLQPRQTRPGRADRGRSSRGVR